MPITAMLVRWIGGWDEVSDPNATITYGRREACLGLGAQQSLPEARRLAFGQLKIFADPRTEIAAAILPTALTEMPWLAFRPGDYITAPEWGFTGQSDERVISIGGAVDANGQVTYSIELRDRILGERERAEQAAKKMTNGTLRGASKVATPAGMVGKRNIPPRTGGGGGG